MGCSCVAGQTRKPYCEVPGVIHGQPQRRDMKPVLSKYSYQWVVKEEAGQQTQSLAQRSADTAG